ncbi:spermine synthase [Caenimonas sedimenti]|uniref:Spermine synthase n=1 Tax=Caenimonas sedimenti TaxID=2596921 RepID=A0A562ZL52_9BURK|nr:spermine synthase [Caenimonas sedimenti]TWO69065.1 spermine synthase [Caenimonas sedimenti]
MTSTDAAAAAPTQRRVAVLYAIFFLSGFCGLIYESIWSHYLKLLLGHASYAQAVVLVVFVGGLALGAWLTGRFSERIRRPILAYAIIEAAVAALAFSFHGIFENVSAWAASEFLPAMCGAPGACSAVWLLAAALILPASILLGSTFPLMSAGVMRLGVAPGRGLSLLYFLNSLGAALGVLGSGFFLLPALGLPGTILLAGAFNVLVALAAYITDSVGRKPAAPAVPSAGPAAPADAIAAPLVPLLCAAAVTGLSSFIYEVVWIRMLTLVMGAATHSFELMLAPFIFGLAIGAWWIRDRIATAKSPLKLLAGIQIAMGLLAVATLPLYVACYDIMAATLRTVARTEEGYLLFNLVSVAIAAAVMLPATICAGMTLPLITALLLRRGHGERQVGQVYGVNTFGAIAGVLVAVHLLIPALGLKWSLAVAAAIDVVLGLVLWGLALRHAPAARPRAAFVWLAGGAVASLAALVAMPLLAPIDATRMASGVFRHGQARVDFGHPIIFHQDGRTATVTVIERPNGVRSLITNGKSDGATHPARKDTGPDDHTMVLLGALGPLHHPQARTAAVIGMGTGTSSAVLLEAKGLTQVDTIEIEPLMVEAAQLFRPRNAKVFDDPRSRIVIDDARAHFAKTRASYDIVVSEPSNPWVSGVAGLFTVQFYRHVSAHLAPDGHFVQWLHLYEASPELVASIIRAFAEVFPEFRAYSANDIDIVLVARNDGKLPALSPQALDSAAGLQRELLQLGIVNVAQLAAHESGRSNAIRLLANSFGAPPNSDFFPYVDHRAASDRFRGRSAKILFSLRDSPVPLLDFVAGAPGYAGQVHSATVYMPPSVRNMASSWHGLRYLRGEALKPEELAYFGSYAPDYALVRSWVADCRFPADTGGIWVSLVRVASDMIPGQTAQAAQSFWQGALRRCGAKLQPAQAVWLELFAAVAGRNPEAIHGPARQVLAQDKLLDGESRAYATLAAVSASYATGRREEAARIFVEQRQKLPPARMETGPMRYLMMLLTAKQKAKASP